MQAKVISGPFWPLHLHFNFMLLIICWFLCPTHAFKMCNSSKIMWALNLTCRLLQYMIVKFLC
jgi:hypothetical protein